MGRIGKKRIQGTNRINENVFKMKLTEIHCNPKNPRLIKDDRFKKLWQSIKEFPKMMSLRPIIIDAMEEYCGLNRIEYGRVEDPFDYD